jgi:peptidoglycan/xylan/chitin deacetylase (PgdA/CDA1 family)
MSAAGPIKRAVAWSLLRSGALDWRRPRFEEGRAAILTYHRVNDEGDRFFPALPRRTFAAQLDYLASRYRVEPLDEVAAWLQAGAPGPPRVALTIDDGYPDTHDVAWPELARRGLPATLFVSTGPLETGRPLWIDRLRFILKGARRAQAELPDGTPLRLDTSEARLSAIRRLSVRLKRTPPAEVEPFLDQLQASARPEGPPPGVLTWAQVRRMADGGLAPGGHTHSHHVVSSLPDERMGDEIAGSMRLLEARSGHPVRTFAYPNGRPGDFDARALDVLRGLGLACAVTMHHAFARPGQDPLLLPRLYTSASSLALFAVRLAGLTRGEASAAPA